jgi:hypothetical protein
MSEPPGRATRVNDKRVARPAFVATRGGASAALYGLIDATERNARGS